MATASSTPHLLGVDDVDDARIDALFSRAEEHLRRAEAGEMPLATLRGRSIVQLFFEGSTRTRASFELAGKSLGAEVVHLDVASSSVGKGETLSDTCRTLAAMRCDALVLRHPASGAAQFVAQKLPCSVINAGDGMHEHPTQALLDAFTLKRKLGRVRGLKVSICGDILHSRVARSNARLLQRLGNEVRLVGPAPLLPRAFAGLGYTLCESLEAAIEGCDVLMVLRLQRERLSEGFLPTLSDYARAFGVREARLAAQPNLLVMHPGPINRGVEIADSVADGGRSLILQQVESGVFMRMAILEWLLGETLH